MWTVGTAGRYKRAAPCFAFVRFEEELTDRWHVDSSMEVISMAKD